MLLSLRVLSIPKLLMQVTLGSQSVQTLTFRQTLNPSYYEAMEMEVILPEMMQLAPDIVVCLQLSACLTICSHPMPTVA